MTRMKSAYVPNEPTRSADNSIAGGTNHSRVAIKESMRDAGFGFYLPEGHPALASREDN